MQLVEVYTLFDITETGVVRSFRINQLPMTAKDGTEIADEQDWRFSRRQQSNLEVLLQTLSLRAQIMDVDTEVHTNQALSKYKFDKKYSGLHAVWVLKFSIEQEGTLQIGDDIIGALYQDCANVPMLTNLRETADVGTHFDTVDNNIYFHSYYK